MVIDAKNMHFQALNAAIKNSADTKIVVNDCMGQRYVGDGLEGKEITINGTPGNALGAYLDGAKIIVNGNVQDAVGDTMNRGEIIVHGGAGDGLALAARGGELYVRDSVGYRAGIHMKQYKNNLPALIVGGCAGSFLGEYLAGGYIVVLGLSGDESGRERSEYGVGSVVGNFCATGMHGGKIFVRGKLDSIMTARVTVRDAEDADMGEILPYIDKFCAYFGKDKAEILREKFHVIEPDSKNPYKRLYVNN